MFWVDYSPGRRCPGSHLIESSLWIVIASFLATFDVGKAVDAQGTLVEPVVAFENAVFRYAPLLCIEARKSG